MLVLNIYPWPRRTKVIVPRVGIACGKVRLDSLGRHCQGHCT